MSAARDAMLGRLRQALGRRDGDGAEAAVAARLGQPVRGPVPARGQLDLPGRLALFTAQAEAVQTDVRRVDRHDQLPAAVVDYLRARNRPMRLVMAVDPLLARADWAGGLLEVRHGRPRDDDPVGLTTAVAGIAETGTVMLLSGADTPTTLAFLPETAIVVLPSARVLPAYEDALDLVRAAGPDLPRSINWVTGPSRSADIEQTLLLGAHGPRQLLILLVDQALDDLA